MEEAADLADGTPPRRQGGRQAGEEPSEWLRNTPASAGRTRSSGTRRWA